MNMDEDLAGGPSALVEIHLSGYATNQELTTGEQEEALSQARGVAVC
jgi:hypothetical protein